ncbi:MAG: transporter substrate-binding domain-containing protein [Methylomonas sp.]
MVLLLLRGLLATGVLAAGEHPAEPPLNPTLNAEEKAWIHEHPVVLYGAEKDWPPFDFVNPSGEPSGLSRDMLILIGKSSGLEFQPVIGAWDDLLKQAEAGKIELLPALIETEERKIYFNFTESYHAMLAYFFVHEAVNAKSMADLDGKTVAIPSSYAQIVEIKKLYPKIKILETDSLMAAVQAVIERKADILLETYSVMNYVLKQNSITSIRPFKALPFSDARQLRMAVRKDNPLLFSIMQKSLAAIPLNEKKEIDEKWLGYPVSQDTDSLELSPEERNWLAAHVLMRVTAVPTSPPFESFDKQGRYIGMAAEYLQAMENKLGVRFEFIPASDWRQAIDMINRHEVDVLSVSRDNELNNHLLVTQPYLSSPIVIVMRDDEDYTENIEQIENRRLAVVGGYGYSESIRRHYPKITFRQTASIEQGLLDVSTGMIDGLLCPLANAGYLIGSQGIRNVRIVGKTEFISNWAFAVRDDYPILAGLMDKALHNIRPSEKQKISENWGKPQFVVKTDFLLLAKIISVFLLLLVLIFFWNRRLIREIKSRKRSEEQVQVLNQRLALATSIASLGIYELEWSDPPQVYFDKQMYEIYGLSDNHKLSYPEWFGYIHADDHALVKASVSKLLAQACEDHIEYRIVRPDGQIRNIYRGASSTIINNGMQKVARITGVNWDITKYKNTEIALKNAIQQAENASRAKTQFLANMSHEIRTPLNAIIGFTELLNEQIKDQRLKSFVQIIQTAGHSLLALINDILDLSKIEAGKMRLDKKLCNPHTLFSELGQIFMIKIREKNLDFILDIDADIPDNLILDATRLRQILFNLIGNAVKFTESGHIRLRARSGNENRILSKLDLYIDVEDTGIGISQDQQALIFQDFEQLEGQDVRKYGGTGLGLAISQRLTQIMDGEISLVSAPGVGSTFTIHLKEVDIASVKIEQAAIDEQKPVRFLPAALLVVDDVADNRALLRACFADAELTVVEVENGLEAVNAVQHGNFDLVLMDIRMPVMDGYQAAEKIKAFSDVPIIALTASVMQDEYKLVKNIHFDGYLRKPVFKADLFKMLMAFLPFEFIESPPAAQTGAAWDAESMPPEIRQELNKLLVVCERISTHNNLTEISDFAESVLNIGRRYGEPGAIKYAMQLQAEIDSFDILAIRRSLSLFQSLQTDRMRR